MNLILPNEDITALKEALVSATKYGELLKSELALVHTECELSSLNQPQRHTSAKGAVARAPTPVSSRISLWRMLNLHKQLSKQE